MTLKHILPTPSLILPTFEGNEIIFDNTSTQIFFPPSSGISSCVRTVDTVMCLHTWRSPACVALGWALIRGLYLPLRAVMKSPREPPYSIGKLSSYLLLRVEADNMAST